MAFSVDTPLSGGNCDLCGRPKAEDVETCPQHRMWKAEAEVKRLKRVLAEIADLPTNCGGGCGSGCCGCIQRAITRAEQAL